MTVHFKTPLYAKSLSHFDAPIRYKYVFLQFFICITKKIPYFIRNLKTRPIVTTFTATASTEVRKDILNMLDLIEPKIFITGFDRENLYINIVKSSAKNKYLQEYIENHKSESGIIYAATRKEVEKIYEGLLKRNIDVLKYHAGMSNEDRG